MEHSNHLQVMFLPYDLEKYPDLAQASKSSFNHLFALVELGQNNGELIRGDTHTMTKSIWALVHGVDSLSATYGTNSPLLEPPIPKDSIAKLMDCLLGGLAVGDRQIALIK